MLKIFYIIAFLNFYIYSSELNYENIEFDEDFQKGQDAYDMQDYNKAIKYLKISAKKNNVDAIWTIGFIYDTVIQHKGIIPDYKEAFYWYKKCALLNDAQCLFNIGNMYQNGNGVEQDYKEAFKWYLKASEQNSIDAYYCLGILYEEGLGVEKNYKEAIKWYKKAADLDNVESIEKIKELNLKIKNN